MIARRRQVVDEISKRDYPAKRATLIEREAERVKRRWVENFVR